VKPKAVRPEIRDLHRRILERLGPSPVPEDQLIRDIGGQASAISSEIAALEIDGHIRRDAGGLLSRVGAA
jgi:DNA processing protein